MGTFKTKTVGFKVSLDGCHALDQYAKISHLQQIKDPNTRTKKATLEKSNIEFLGENATYSCIVQYNYLW